MKRECCKRIEYRRYLNRTSGLLRVSEEAYQKSSGTDADVAGMYVLWPVLFAFLCHVLERARATGCFRLYFLARDGWLMKKMAEKICGIEKIQMECRYLYASRYAWRIPEHHLIGQKCLERICRGGMEVSFARLMERAGLTEEEGHRIAALIHLPQSYISPLSWKEIQELRQPLSECREFMELVSRRSREQYEAAVSYLEQEALLEPVPFAVVDSGWIGTMQESLQNLLDSMGWKGKVQGFYFGLYNLPEGAEEKNYDAFYFAPPSGARKKAHFSNCLFECIFSAPHGMTQGYTCRQNMEPVLEKPEQINVNKTKVQERLLEIWLDVLEKNWHPNLWKEARTLDIRPLLESFMSRPSREEVRWYGGYLFSDELTGEGRQPLALPLTKMELLKQQLPFRLWFMLGPGRHGIKESGWLEGSIRLYGGSLHTLYRAGAVFYKYLLYLRMQHRFRAGRKAA